RHALLVFSSSTRVHPNLHSFPTRRSSDLVKAYQAKIDVGPAGILTPGPLGIPLLFGVNRPGPACRNHQWRAISLRRKQVAPAPRDRKSTRLNSSRSDLVCRLLLEKKKLEE